MFLLTLCKELDDPFRVARCALRLGSIAINRSELDEARGRYEEALTLYRSVGDVQGEANVIQRLGNVALRRSDHDEARRRYEQAISLHQDLGDLLVACNNEYGTSYVQ